MSTSSFPAAACRRKGSLDRLQARLLPARARAVASLPPALPRRARSPTWAGRLVFLGDLAPLGENSAFDATLAPLRRPSGWSTPRGRSPGRRPSSPISPATPTASHLERPADRARRQGRDLQLEDYRIKGRDRLKTMTLDAREFIRRFLLHVLPSGFHRIRHYGLFAGGAGGQHRARPTTARRGRECAPAFARGRQWAEDVSPARRCPCCGGRMIIVETFEGPRPWRSPSPSRIRIDSS